jgi:kinesin family protein 5
MRAVDSTTGTSSLSTTLSTEESRLRVYCRFRPLLTDAERRRPATFRCYTSSVVINDAPSLSAIHLTPRASDESLSKVFAFERVFDTKAPQSSVYDRVGAPIVRDALAGYNGTIIVYGHTGVGKSFTMEGPPETLDGPASSASSSAAATAAAADEAATRRGLVPRVVRGLFATQPLDSPYSSKSVSVSFFEVYNGKLRDLLDDGDDGGGSGGGGGRLHVQDVVVRDAAGGGGSGGGRFAARVQGLVERRVDSPRDALRLLEKGKRRRMVARTAASADSSRGHSIFQITVRQSYTGPPSTVSSPLHNADGSTTGLLTSVVRLVDLAGSEQAESTGMERARLLEARAINTSLLCLGNVIASLAARDKHVSYRDSILTRVLQQSLSGNSRTALIVNASPAAADVKKTLNSLRFGQVARTLTTHARFDLKVKATRGELLGLLEESERALASRDDAIVALTRRVDEQREKADAGDGDKQQWESLMTQARHRIQQLEQQVRSATVAM